MLDAVEFAFLVLVGSVVATLVMLNKYPLEKSVTFGSLFGSFAFAAVGIAFAYAGMDALDTNALRCGRGLHRHICQRDDFDFWLKLGTYYVAAVICIGITLLVICTGFIESRAPRRH